MDIVLEAPGGVVYVDVTCYHPFTRAGSRRTHATGGTPQAQENRKRDRYPVQEGGTRRRMTLARFVPVAVTTYGRVGPAAIALFRELEADACERGSMDERDRGRLSAIVAETAVYGAARMVLRAGSPPNGQERAHLHGRAAT